MWFRCPACFEVQGTAVCGRCQASCCMIGFLVDGVPRMESQLVIDREFWQGVVDDAARDLLQDLMNKVRAAEDIEG